MDWKEEAAFLYKNNIKVKDIAKALNLSRKTVSKFLNSLSGSDELKKERKNIAITKRKIYKKNYAKNNEAIAHMLKRQHEIDVRVLSSERFFNE